MGGGRGRIAGSPEGRAAGGWCGRRRRRRRGDVSCKQGGGVRGGERRGRLGGWIDVVGESVYYE